MPFNREHWESLKSRWKEERSAYLDSINVKESEIKRKIRYGGTTEVFDFDGTTVEVPNHLQTVTKFIKWLKGK